ncbi:cilia- and flagella-associated protein 299 isoform X3 [Chiloscyllium punctatum]|uniref:cilia- and flagella-associated protein 299 isoform X3 n=1 Tax=Chiloscyllium punctatum TaxID=137246 RepID=UPI003B64202B
MTRLFGMQTGDPTPHPPDPHHSDVMRQCSPALAGISCVSALVLVTCGSTVWILASAGKDLKDNFLIALAEREEANRSGRMASIIFIRDYNSHGQEISGYIDYSHRLKVEQFEGYFSGKKKLLPRSTDLSFYNWDTQNCTCNSSPFYQVATDNASGLLFKNKRDRKTVHVDPKVSPGDNTTRNIIETDLYVQVVIYDHTTRRKS